METYKKNRVLLREALLNTSRLRLKGLSETAMRMLIHKDIKASGYSVAQDAQGEYIDRYARERAENLWSNWRSAQQPADARERTLAKVRTNWWGVPEAGVQSEDVIYED